ncbi:trypsin-like serine peptidase [Roseitranquillus sediminis]|uniref:trypsin-like serine peptidase n=1 Tax=Roseitranquillus sediminis TaxID=2809051 RepID=UPI0022216DE9|nr:serine protease [Roseitranquillus sediminis]MBM9594120.1 trypsin-like peptidase domain-containing protein [Roseitranquillus sediminis]
MQDDGHTGQEQRASAAERELALRERELDLKAADLDLRRHQNVSGGWRSPLVVAVLAATAAALGNAVVAIVGGMQERQLAAQEAEHARILEMIKTGDPDDAAANLDFLLAAGLIETPATVANLRRFLDERAPGTGPTLAASTPYLGGIVGADDAAPVADLGAADVSKLARAVDLLSVAGADGASVAGQCTAFLVAPDRIATVGFCATGQSTFTLDPEGAATRHEVDRTPIEIIWPDTMGGAVILTLAQPVGPDVHPLTLAEAPPAEGAPAGILYFRGNTEQLAVWGGDACRIVRVNDTEIEHSCDTGPGTSGSPVFDVASGTVVGVHYRRSEAGGIAYRLDRAALANRP